VQVEGLGERVAEGVERIEEFSVHSMGVYGKTEDSEN
jgi:hypothetical protein